MTKITPTQRVALEAVRNAGTIHAYNGVSHATVTVLERLGLVSVTRSVQTWTNRRSQRNHSQLDWSATIIKEAP
jgi:hypothetical protein